MKATIKLNDLDTYIDNYFPDQGRRKYSKEQVRRLLMGWTLYKRAITEEKIAIQKLGHTELTNLKNLEDPT